MAGVKRGTKLRQLPIGEKMRWRDWLKKHPDTLVLSIDGREDAPNRYAGYFLSPQGFRDAFARDGRLRTKTPIFAFRLNEKAYAVPFKAIKKQGSVFQIDGASVLLYRKDRKLYNATIAYISRRGDFVRRDGTWLDLASGCRFDPASGTFVGDERSCPEKLPGFDTFWYTWSLSNPTTNVLK